jgi:signal transduction histidine kinase
LRQNHAPAWPVGDLQGGTRIHHQPIGRPGETNSGELRSVVLVNRVGDIVAAAPTNVVFPSDQIQGGPRWGDAVVWLPNLVDLGTNLSEDLVVLPRDVARTMRTNRPAGSETNPGVALTTTIPTPATNPPPRGNAAPGRRGAPPQEFVKPAWMLTEDFRVISEKQGAHNFFVGMSTEPVQEAAGADLWIRIIIGLLGTAGVVGYALAWQSLVKTSDLQVRLVRASEMNLHLKEMNLAAAGLAHETRNPLNIIRGLAQIISKQQDASGEIRAKTRDIIDETDRVTAQLNEFINYSRAARGPPRPDRSWPLSWPRSRAL